MSRKAPTDAPKKCLFCEVRQGGGAYGKSASGAAFPGVSFFAHMFFPGLSPGSVDNRVSVFEKGESARRSRTTERSESVSEEAEERLNWHFLLTHLCGISHRTWRTFHTIRTDAEWLSQYTLRYRYVTGSGLRPDTPKVNGLTRPGGLVCSRHPLTDKLLPSPGAVCVRGFHRHPRSVRGSCGKARRRGREVIHKYRPVHLRPVR